MTALSYIVAGIAMGLATVALIKCHFIEKREREQNQEVDWDRLKQYVAPLASSCELTGEIGCPCQAMCQARCEIPPQLTTETNMSCTTSCQATAEIEG